MCLDSYNWYLNQGSAFWWLQKALSIFWGISSVRPSRDWEGLLYDGFPILAGGMPMGNQQSYTSVYLYSSHYAQTNLIILKDCSGVGIGKFWALCSLANA